MGLGREEWGWFGLGDYCLGEIGRDCNGGGVEEGQSERWCGTRGGGGRGVGMSKQREADC